MCCGLIGRMQFDHIIPVSLYPSNSVSSQITLAMLKRDSLQFLCESCNKSKAVTPYCRIHKKYLGIWNYLPKLDKMEQ